LPLFLINFSGKFWSNLKSGSDILLSFLPFSFLVREKYWKDVTKRLHQNDNSVNSDGESGKFFTGLPVIPDLTELTLHHSQSGFSEITIRRAGFQIVAG